MLKYWLWLTTLPLLNYRKIPALLRTFGTPEAVYFASKADIMALEIYNGDEINALCNKSLDRAESILEQCQNKHIRLVTMQDAEYPPQLHSLEDAPGVLYVLGQLATLAIEPAIGVVGTRDASAYGLNVSARFGYHLSKGGMTIISGMAKGIDAAAHQGALRADRPTVAVLGCGADVIYPYENESLYYDIVERGAVISEFPPGTKPLPGHFPRRNRLISGLALGVLVVEAPRKSGALITADQAQDQGRDVFVIPGNIDAVNSAGCNWLIREYATLVTKPRDILEEYTGRYGVLPSRLLEETPPMPKKVVSTPVVTTPPALTQRKAAPPSVTLTPLQQTIVDALCHGALTADQIITETNLETQVVLAELTSLEIFGVVASTDQGLFVKVGL